MPESRAQAVITAIDVLGSSSDLADVLKVAEFIAGTSAPEVGMDVARARFYGGFDVRGVRVIKDTAGDADLVVLESYTNSLTIPETKALIAYLQDAVRVGEAEGTGPKRTDVVPF